MVSWLRRRRLSVSPLAFAGWARRFRRARDPRTTVAWSVSGRVRRDDVAREYGARTAQESLRLKLIGSGRAARLPRCAAQAVILTGDTRACGRSPIWKESVLEKWFWENAQRVFRLPTFHGRPLVKIAMVSFLNPPPALSLGDGNWSSCPFADARGGTSASPMLN